MTHLRQKPPAERTPEWLIGLLIAIVLVTVGWFFLRSIGAGDDPVLGDASTGESEAAAEAWDAPDGLATAEIQLQLRVEVLEDGWVTVPVATSRTLPFSSTR